MEHGGEYERADLPWFLTIHWVWLVVAQVVAGELQAFLRWDYLSHLNVLILWSFLQAGWLMRVDQRSTALFWYVGDLLAYCAGWFMSADRIFPVLASMLLGIAGLMTLVSLFDLRRDMTRYFADTDELDLNMSPWMTFFFNTLYFQYQFRVVAQSRRSSPRSMFSSL